VSSNVTCKSYGACKSTYGGQPKISVSNEHVTEISTYYKSGSQRESSPTLWI